MNEYDDSSLSQRLNEICKEFEEQWSHDTRTDIGKFLDRIDEPNRKRLLEWILDADVELRLQFDQQVDPADYQRWGEIAVKHVRTLLQQRFRAKERQSLGPPVTTESVPHQNEQIPIRIGPYKLRQQIGEGGMGTVWMADQEKPVRRRVALKLIRGDMGSKEVIARFEAERQALAMMDHQNIAKVLDAGTTETGNPYFVMELVKGIPITKYCDENRLSIPERLELFVPVCKAVQHAHQKGIIHRDLKPSNVLVTLYDGNPVPKVIDFGLAKALEHTNKLTDKTLFTEFGKVVGTVQYMAPEQAEMNALDVDTRADVYSLGIMLYELLTGSTPLDKETLGKNALLQILAIIREKEPPKPSARLSDSADTITGISELRRIAPSKLQQILRGELDWVVMKALEKNRTRRYETPNKFAKDIERYLNDDTVAARPPSAAYRIKKFVQKNRSVVASATLIILIVSIATASLLIQRASNKSQLALNEVENDQERAESYVNALLNAAPDAVPHAINNLKTLRGSAIPILRGVFEDKSTESRNRLHSAFALAELTESEGESLEDDNIAYVEFLVDHIAEASPEYCDNFVSALRKTEQESITLLKQKANEFESAKSWQAKARVGILSLHMGDASIAAGMLRATPEKSPRPPLPDILGNLRSRLEKINQLPAEQQTNRSVRRSRAWANYHLDNINEALEDLNNLATGKSVSPKTLLLQSVCLARQGLAEESKKPLARREALGFGQYKAYGQILVQAWLGNIKQANRQLEELIASSANSETTQYLAARAAAQLIRVCRAKELPGKEEHLKAIVLEKLRYFHYAVGAIDGHQCVADDPDFLPLHGDKDFQLLVGALAMRKQAWDPLQRTTFIAEFGDWIGDDQWLAERMRGTDVPHLRSGICLSINGIERPSEKLKNAWKNTLEYWYETATDSGTHSAARWALSQWKLSVPKIGQTRFPPSDRSWWHVSELHMVKIPAGSTSWPLFVFDDFWLSDCEVALRLFQEFTGDTRYNGLKPISWFALHPYAKESLDPPVHNVSWYDAIMFCNWLSWKLNLKPCYEIVERNKNDRTLFNESYSVKQVSTAGFRLPTEREWEYSCRAMTTTKYCFGDKPASLGDYGWFVSNCNGLIHSVAAKRCNSWGLFDMHGNVKEWCWDKTLGHESVEFRMQRGSDWTNIARESTSTLRSVGEPMNGSAGFRVAFGGAGEINFEKRNDPDEIIRAYQSKAVSKQRMLQLKKRRFRIIGLAIMNYQSAHLRYPFLEPKDSVNSSDLSWRVKILPYLGETYDMMVPQTGWNSKENRFAVKRMPGAFGESDSKTKICWVRTTDQTFHDIKDGGANTIMLIENPYPVTWTRPIDVDIESAVKIFEKLGEKDSITICLYNGSVKEVSKEFGVENFKAALTPAGGEVVKW